MASPVWYFLNGVPVIPVINIGSATVSGGLGVGVVETGAGIIGASAYIHAPRLYPGAGATSSVLIAPTNGALSIRNNGETASILLDSGSAANGQAMNLINTLTELTTVAASATTDTTIQMPAGAVVLGVSVRVTTVIPTATSFSVGDSGSAARFSTTNVGVAAGSTDPGTKAGAYYNASALSVRLTMNGGTPAANTGRVRVTIYYYTVTPPTS